MIENNFDFLIVSLFICLVVIGTISILKLTKNKTKKVSNLRFFIQIMAVITVFMGLILGPFGTPLMAPLGIAPRDRLIGADFFGYQFPDGLPIPVLGCYFASGRTVTCPIWEIQAYIFPFWNTGRGYNVFYSTTGIERLAIIFGFFISLAIILGRFFCGWLCPLGLYMDLLTRLRKITGKHHLNLSENTNNKLRQSRYIIIAIFLIISVIFGSQAIFGTMIIPETQVGGPAGTEAGFVTANFNAPFCVVCPMRPLCALTQCALGFMDSSYIFHLMSGPFYLLGYYVTSLNLIILGIITALSLIFRRFWCRICPLGGLTDLFSTFNPFKKVALTRLVKNGEKCTKCGVCKRVCPTQVTEIYDKKEGDVTVSGCMLCFRCVEMCPYEGALKVKFAGKQVLSSRNWLD